MGIRSGNISKKSNKRSTKGTAGRLTHSKNLHVGTSGAGSLASISHIPRQATQNDTEKYFQCGLKRDNQSDPHKDIRAPSNIGLFGK